MFNWGFFFCFVDLKEFFCLAVGVFWTLLLMFESSKGRSWVHSWSSLNRWPSLANLRVLLPLSSLLWREKVSLLVAVNLWKLDSTGLSPYSSKLWILKFIWVVVLMYTVFFLFQPLRFPASTVKVFPTLPGCLFGYSNIHSFSQSEGVVFTKQKQSSLF